MGQLFFTFIYQPLLNALVFLYSEVTFEDLGLAVILLTVAVRLVFWPLFHKAAKSQAVMQKIQPEIKRLQKEYKNDKAKQAELTMSLYKKYKINPFSGLFMIGIQIPIIFALYRVFLNGFSDSLHEQLYSFIPQVSEINHYFLGVVDLTERSIIIALMAAALQYAHGKLSFNKTKGTIKSARDNDNPMASMQKHMMYFFPVFTVMILWNLQAVIGVYWTTTTLFSLVQQIFINKHLKEDAESESSSLKSK